jgi:hypothetical protein
MSPQKTNYYFKSHTCSAAIMQQGVIFSLNIATVGWILWFNKYSQQHFTKEKGGEILVGSSL